MPSLQRRLDAFLKNRAPQVERFKAPLSDRVAMVRRYGDFSLAYSTAVQPGLHYFGDAAGYVAYGSKMHHNFALGDPVADPSDRPAYIRRFVETAGSPAFVQIGDATANVLAELGYRINRLGVDTHLSLPDYDFSGKSKETLRYSERWLAKRGYDFAEVDAEALSLDEITRLSENWRASRIVNRWEMAFLNRPFSPLLGPSMRRFVLRNNDGNLIALLDFDPLFRDEKVIGYTTAFKRKRVGASSHAEIGLTKYAIDKFRKEDISVVTLGLSPLLDVGPSGHRESRFWRSAFQAAFRSAWVNQRRFNLQGQAAFKRRFHGTEHPTYIAVRKGSALEMLNLLRLMKAL